MENNPFAPSGCSKDKSIDYCAWIKAKLGIDKTTVINGFYPLKITVNGYEYNHSGTQKMTYNNQVYKINYEPEKGYQAPENYPVQ
ncbi:hypothetical protein ACT3TH_04120 [Psychrobacter sp. AOP22-C1-C5]|uniref:hypothetical protein n=1 Tax=Psychrobacter sp. AOP22-C1-C5 TaxID=3457716 RepID=UPI0040371AE4